MNIRTKVLVSLAAMFLALGGVQIAIQRHVLMPSFADLERDDARTAMRRINYAMDSALDRLETVATDWGNWSDTYRFIHDRNADYLDANFTPIALKQLKINAMLIVGLDGQIIVHSVRDLENGSPLRLDLAESKALPGNFPWRKNLREGRPARGLIATNLGIMMLAASPVLDGAGKGPARGMVIVGRLFGPAQVHEIGAEAQASVALHAARHSRPLAVPAEFEQDDEVTRFFRTFPDIDGQPLLTLKVEVPREMSARGEAAIAYSSIGLIIAAIGALLMLVIILNRVVLSPLRQVTQHAVVIGQGDDLTARLNLPDHDEIGHLAREFDRMVERVAITRQELLDQSFHAGFAEMSRGVLHNLGNAMTPLGVKLSTLSDRLRDAPLADVEFALQELARNDSDSARRGDLEEFLRLGFRELSSTIKQSESDVALMQRQASVIQSALSEQMRSSRQEHVTENVRLPELVAQSLEIVPDECRRRLIVKPDESLRRIGVVHVARTVLRLILQNFIINAADAVRASGREQGELQIEAKIVRDADQEHLYLHCKDDGVGIASDHLQRVFEKGFSTKSRSTNYGIGLHWCANAIAALGGRIWASSEGLGRGAAMHLMVPLVSRQTGRGG